MKFRKKPVVIDAIQWTGDNFDEIYTFIYGNSDRLLTHWPDRKEITIDTLEDRHTAIQNDWIIKGVKGEFYPCKPDIFEATYEVV